MARKPPCGLASGLHLGEKRSHPAPLRAHLPTHERRALLVTQIHGQLLAVLIDSQIQHDRVLLGVLESFEKLHRIKHQEDLLFHGIKERSAIPCAGETATKPVARGIASTSDECLFVQYPFLAERVAEFNSFFGPPAGGPGVEGASLRCENWGADFRNGELGQARHRETGQPMVYMGSIYLFRPPYLRGGAGGGGVPVDATLHEDGGKIGDWPVCGTIQMECDRHGG